MPTIEIVSLNATKLNLNQDDFDIAMIEENKLISHHGLFYDFLRKQKGVIIHIGNPYFKQDGFAGFFAGQIVDWSFQSKQRFKFSDKYKSDIDRLLQASMKGSPNFKVYFLTDYQFGPKKETFEIAKTIIDFWALHDEKGLKLNTLYAIHEE